MDNHSVSNIIISSRQRRNSQISTVMAGISTGHLNCLSPWEQRIAARIFIQLPTKSKRIDRSLLFRNISCLYRRHMGQWPDQAILLVLQVKHNQIKQNVQKLSRGKSNINNTSSHLNKPLQRNRVLRMNCTVRNHRIVPFENTIAHEFIEGVLCSVGQVNICSVLFSYKGSETQYCLSWFRLGQS